ncbi:MAG TPA: hypothetical protein DCR24_08380 [Bacillus bacterium]|nr:hypothetical protein [Bacillus sp. (in: firmicutes)]
MKSNKDSSTLLYPFTCKIIHGAATALCTKSFFVIITIIERSGSNENRDIYGDLPILKTERLILRKISLDDVRDIHTYASNPEVSKFVSWDTHRSIGATEDYVSFIMELYRKGMIAPWGIEYREDSRLIGTIDFVSWKPEHKTAEIGYALSKDRNPFAIQ